jgi:glyoxylase-like metal-dependent hydrolase (beta-lactamase superfamily II)
MKFFVHLLLFIAMPFLVAGQSKLQIKKLREDFYIFTTWQSFKGTPFPANGMYVVSSDGVLMIDTPWDSTQFQPLLDSIEERHHQPVKICIATHSHEDRTGGLEYYSGKGIKTFTSLQTDSICRKKKEKRAEFVFTKDTVFTFGQHSCKTIYGGPAHTPDNIVVWFGKEKVLYGGCLVKSTEAKDLGNLNDANVNAWPKTIQYIQQKVGKPDYVIPGHQDWSNKKSLEHTRSLLNGHSKKK